MRVKEIMAGPLVCVGPQTPLKEVAQLLLRHRITGVPVIDETGSVLGVVSQADLVREEQAAESESLRSGTHRIRLRRTRDVPRRTAADVMSAPALEVEPQSSAVRAAWLMSQHDVNRLIVMERGVAVGIVTRTDLIRAFARSDEDVRREIVEDVLPSLGMSPNDIAVSVDRGEVVLSGALDDELQARWLPHAVRCVLGVVAVDSRLEPGHTPVEELVTPGA